MIKSVIRIAAAAAMVSALSSIAYAKDPMVGGAAMYATKNIIQNAVNSKDHTTLVAAVKAAGLVDTLQGKGPFTVFAPTNEAFAQLPAGTVDTLLKPENKEKLTKILTCHVVSGDDMAAAIKNWAKTHGGEYDLKTVGGCTIKAMNKGGKLTLTDEAGGTAHITIADVKQSNGVIHVVDKVLLPKM
ncbi:fasciclin domain-containing protein [Rhizobium sp. P38BS-XIX]|uniref:fasciclin domain-containing protein n=1 Tax=Rhizobium sp. P38BS-XIX TaxID=2726740 RepID=UPI001456B347|nr:fasciclin domain-containing protein [Rhizobium sp. P38BS-XIX]NLR98804.1 fasciclin domain-containing protein [Rhizobium sp. P38BS-XIX]